MRSELADMGDPSRVRNCSQVPGLKNFGRGVKSPPEE